jgi:hypothetical protein
LIFQEEGMSDAVSGLLVAAVTAAAVAGIFLWMARAKRRKIEALRALCAQRGWRYSHESGPLHHGHHIVGDGWTFEAVSRSSGRETAPGSFDWGHSSQWTVEGEDPGRSTFILGSRMGGMLDISKMPPALLSRFLGEEMAGFQVFSAGERLDSRFVLFAGEWPPAASLFSSWAEELLLGWPAALPLVVRSSPARLSLQVMNRRLEKPAEVAALIELGESFSSPYQNT